MMNKLSRRQFLLASVGVSCGLLLPAEAKAGNIGELNGIVYINKLIATNNSTIKAGDLVTTSKNASISLVLAMMPSC